MNSVAIKFLQLYVLWSQFKSGCDIENISQPFSLNNFGKASLIVELLKKK